MKKPSVAKQAKKGEKSGPDVAMIFMLAGAACKVVELLILRDSPLRHYFALAGGILITIGSGIVCWTSIQVIRGVYPVDGDE